MKLKLRLFLPCYYAFFVSGAMVLMVGAVLPYLIEEAGMSYSAAGGLLSAFAIGNLLASFVNPALAARIGRKATIVCLSALTPLMFLLMTYLPPVWVMYAAFVLIGIGRGSVSIINNAIVNDNSNGRPAALNLLHMTFAVGAFLSPFLTSLFIGAGLGWRSVVYAISGALIAATIGYAFMRIDYNWPKESKKAAVQKDPGSGSRTRKPFYQNPLFYIMGILLFLYLGLENCVNGWFVTYFKGMGIMSSAYATNLVSVTWVMVMLGRLLTAKISGIIDKNKLIVSYCIATAVFFIMLIATHNLVVITIAIAGLGFFFAGIYPTSISSVGQILKGDQTGMSMFLAIAALGGIITPQLVGLIADRMGLTGAILILLFNAAGMLVLSALNLKLNRKGKADQPLLQE